MKWKIYPQYKHTYIDWLGDIPGHWDVVRFKNQIQYQEGPGIMASDFKEEGIPLLRIGNVQRSEVQLEGCNFLSEEKVRSQWTHFKLAKGDLLISCSATTGTVSEVTCEAEGSIAYTGIIRLRPKKSNIHKEYIKWLVSSDLFNTQVDLWKTGSTIQHFGPTHLDQMAITLPSIEEQNSIALLLNKETSRIDQLIAKKEQQIELLQEKRSALITHAVTKGLNPKAKMKDSGIEWLGEIPGHWKLIPLKRLLAKRRDAIKTGPFGSQLLSSEMLSGQIKVYNQRNVIDNDFESGENYISVEKYAELKAFTIERGDVLVTTRGTIGRCSLFPDNAEEGILHPCLMRVQSNQCILLREYLAMLIQDGGIVQLQLSLMSNSTTIEVIYSESLKSVLTPVPPIDAQKVILSKIKDDTARLELLTRKVNESIERLREYRTTLISAAVTGKIDVREEVA